MLFFAVSASTGRSQSPTVGRCADCTLVATHVARLGADEDGPDITRTTVVVVRDSRGRLIAGPVNDRNQFAVFSPAGKLIKVVGRAGSGPGEFRMINGVAIAAGDSILVHDIELQRLSIFDPELRYVRSFPFPQHRRLSVGADGFLYGVGGNRAEKAAGFAVHRYSLRDGTRTDSFEQDSTVARYDNTSINTTFVAGQVAPDVFVVRDNPYKIIRRDPKGLAVPLNYQPSWLPYPRSYRTKPGRPGTKELYPEPPILLEPQPHVRGARTERDGTLWISGSVATADWRKHRNPHEPMSAREGTGPQSKVGKTLMVDHYERLSKWYTNVIDVVSVKDAKLVDRARLPFTTGWLLGDGYVAGLVTNDDGALIVDVWRLSRPQ